MSDPGDDATAIRRLLDLMARLRAPDGCPWDREQTPESLKPQMLEECYEVLEAIDTKSPTHLQEELGDLLLHIVFQAQIAREAGQFTFADVVNGIADKMLRRHPHVFGDVKVADAAGTVALWQELKKVEKPERDSALDGVPLALPALLRAEALQKKARHVGFDWPDPSGSLAKVREEIAEVAAEIEAISSDSSSGNANRQALAGEMGDLLFSIVNLARHWKLNAEELLTGANDKFSRRFRAVEERLRARGRAMQDCALEELDAAWNEVKAEEKAPSS
jgi:MazG family protein